MSTVIGVPKSRQGIKNEKTATKTKIFTFNPHIVSVQPQGINHQAEPSHPE